jgi:hypothetical protein
MDRPEKPVERPQQPGDGIRGMNTTTLFRITNFELYAKPNKVVMTAGLVAITGCVAYLYYMNLQHKKIADDKSVHVGLAEDGNLYIRPKKSSWD